MHRTNQFRIPCPQCAHSILVTEKPQAMFAAFQILSFERIRDCGSTSQKTPLPDPAGGYKCPETKNVSAILSPQPIRTTLPRCRDKKAVLPYNISPRFHSSAEPARLRVTACRPSFPPSDRRRPCELLIFACQPYDQLLSSNRSGQICPPRK